MDGNALSLGKLFGIQFRLHYTWFIVFVLITVSLSVQYFPATYTGWSTVTYWITGIMTSLIFFASVVAHELAHSLVAKANDIPVHSITLFIFGGLARISKEAAKAGTELKIAIAGPACSLAIAGLFAIIWVLARDSVEVLAAMAWWLAIINGILAVFNLIPGFPLDGGRVFRALIWRFTGKYYRSTRIATLVGRGVGYLFILGGIVIMFLFGDWLNGLWLAFIGWFLESAASGSYRQAQWREGLTGFTAREVMTSDFQVIPSSMNLSDLVQSYIFSSGRHSFMVASEGKLSGILTLHDIKSIPQRNWLETMVKEVMTPVDRLKVAYPEQEALTTLEQMVESNINQLPVVKDGSIIGMVTRDNLLRFLRARIELGEHAG